HTPELQSDAAARRELEARMQEANASLRDELGGVLLGSHPCKWFFDGESLALAGPQGLSRTLSEICKRVYQYAPSIHNELVNRRHVSSSAAAARRSLLEAMITKADHERLGLSGTTPALGIYRSILERHGIHRQHNGTWGFFRPVTGGHCGFRKAWRAIEQKLEEAQERRTPVPLIHETLTAPPYGIREGVLPIILAAFLLAHGDEVALYEDDTFVPRVTPPVAERLTRAPHRFEIQLCRISGARAQFLDLLLGRAANNGHRPTVLRVVRELVRQVADLPEFARTTKNLDQTTVAVREAILRAREPAALLFEQLPGACGMPAIRADAAVSMQQLEEFASRLKGALRALSRAYPRLLGTIEEALAQALDIRARGSELRAMIRQRALCIKELAADPETRSFAIRATDEMLGDNEWIVSMGTFLVGKPPESWTDRDVEALRSRIATISLRFKAYEALALARNERGADGSIHLVRLSVVQPYDAERAGVFAVAPADQERFDALCRRLRT
ncbi:MAG: hypothetical protein D6815_11820, partial [Candidatus Dadabacteria bacterium]